MLELCLFQLQTISFNLSLSKQITAILLAGTFELNDRCVNQCPTGSMSVPSETGGMKCQDCDGGICPKGTIITYYSMEATCIDISVANVYSKQ